MTAGTTRRILVCTMNPMTSAKKKALEVRVSKHHKKHKLVQSWVSQAMWEALTAMAQSQNRKLANLVRTELGKIVGIKE